MKKFIATTSLLLPLIAAAAAAHAGSTITDRSYWPNEARKSQVDRARSNPSDAFASDVYAPNSLMPTRSTTGNAWRYQGGPKGR
ncbi:MAG: hypothetical protein AB1582_21745 [Pseudomonadota bacterium]